MRLKGCPYAHCDSLWCVSHPVTDVCPFATEESTMDEFHYIAVAGNQNSGHCKTVEEAHKWAANYLNNNKSPKVYIYEVLSVCEKEIPPIKTRGIYAPRTHTT